MEQIKETSISQRIGLRVKELRLERGWTQAELGRHAKLEYQAISRLERGGHPPNVATLEKIADAFELEMREPF